MLLAALVYSSTPPPFTLSLDQSPPCPRAINDAWLRQSTSSPAPIATYVAGLAALLDGLSAELVRLALWESSGEEFSEAGGAGPTKEWIDARIGQETRMISIVLRSLVQLTRPSRILWEALARTWTTFAQFTSSEILRVRDEVGDCVSNDNAGLPSRPPVLIRHAVVLQSLLMLGVVGHKAPVGSRMYREAYRLIQAEFAAVMPLENEQEAERRRYRELADEVFHKMDPRQQQGWRDLVRSGALLRVGVPPSTHGCGAWCVCCSLLSPARRFTDARLVRAPV